MKLEIQGQTVEVDDKFSELDPIEQQRTVDEIARRMGVSPTVKSPESTAAMLAAPAVTGAGLAAAVPTAATIYQQGIRPFGAAVPGAFQAYVREPIKAAVDIGAMALGSPVPPVGAIEAGKSVKSAFEAGRQVVSNIGEAIGRLPPGTDQLAKTFVEGLNPVDQGRFLRLANEKGIETAFKTFQAPNYLTPDAMQSLRATQQAFPSMAQKAARVAAPALGAVARVAGPAGMAYDLYEAGQLARQTQLGQRLAQGQGQLAEQAFRGGMGQTYQGPQLSPEQAQAVLQSGSQRDIQYFGGPDRLTQLIRQRAAQRVLGPVAGPVAPQ